MKQHLRGWLAGTTWLLAAASACTTAEPVPTAPVTPVGGSAAVAGAQTAAGSAATAAAGTGAAGMAAGAAGMPAGGGSDTTCGPKSMLPGPMLHDAAKAVLLPKAETPMSPCAFGSCHTEKVKKAQLVLDLTVTDLKTILVDKPSCEAAALKLVDSSGGDAGLNKSWLWLKLAAPADASGTLTPNPAWGAPGSCGQMSGQEYGVKMPYGSEWEPSKRQAVKDWICAGAPGPT